MNFADWMYHRWYRWIDDPWTGEQTLRHLATIRFSPGWTILNPGEMIIRPDSWFGRFLLASFDMREAADRMEWDWPKWD